MSTIDHGTRLTRAEAEIRELRKGQELIFGKLDAIAGALSDMKAHAGLPLRDMLDMGLKIGLLISVVAGGIIYLARGGNTESMHALDKRLQAVELRLPYKGM